MILPKFTVKPWGSETLWAHTEQYVGKILKVHCGEALSIQYHHYKDETMYVLSGKGYVNFYELEISSELVSDAKPILVKQHLLNSGDGIHIPPRQVHNVEAIEDMVILEASTNHLDDLVRVRDRYGR